MTFSPGLDWNPAWSPDGSKIVFESSRSGVRDIYVMNLEGFVQTTRLTFNPTSEGDAIWSPDGTKIAFWSDRDGDGEIFVMNADGSGQAQLTFSTDFDGGPDWSPDGSKLVFSSSRAGNIDVFAMNADGSGETRLTTHPAIDAGAIWSPDGTRIAVSSNRDFADAFTTFGPLYEVYLIDPDGSNPTRLTFNMGPDVVRDWQALGDSDEDGVPDADDNCPGTSNPDQRDTGWRRDRGRVRPDARQHLWRGRGRGEAVDE